MALVVIPNFATPEECAAVRDLFPPKPERISESLVQSTGPLRDLRTRCHATVLRHAGGAAAFWDHAAISVMPPGDGHVAHADNSRRLTQGGWGPNHTPWRNHTSLLYLGGTFVGGELVLRNLEVTITPREGLFVSFPCGPEYEHEVPQVRGGHRFALAMWFTDDRRWMANALPEMVAA